MPQRPMITSWVIAWLAIALAVRLVAAIGVERIVSATPGRLCLIEGDASGYWELGQKIAQGKEYSLYDPPRRILRMPGFPLILAACQTVFGDEVFPVRCVLAGIGTLGCWFVYLLACELADATVGLWALAAVSLSPPLVVFSPLLLTETTFATAMVASLIPLAHLLRTHSLVDPAQVEHHPPRWRSAVLTGVLIGVATYIRPTWLPVAGLAAVVIGFHDRITVGRWRLTSWLEGAALLMACGVLLAPWTVRNYRVCGHVVPTTLWVGPSLYDGLHPGATGDSDMTFFDEENLMSQLSEYEVDQEYRRRAWEFARRNPTRTLELAWIKACRYWSPWPNAAQFDRPVLQYGLLAATLPLYLGAVLGVIIRRRDWRFWVFTCGPAVFFCCVHLFFVGSIRYRLPADYVLWIAAASAGVAARDRWFAVPRDGGIS